ncbi:type IV pilus modification PilV family protein [Paenibacillus dokdonensis]|uniref:type IV pilus modification PilV family protein n=1 Tax=Paenibacillus dokdonensis TaxID=2567944 RepID=UPI001457C25A|nr:type II secretion system protein [Paenibacillus dokdonensis]
MKSKSSWRKGLADESGLTLIEILIAVSIMGIISVSLMGYFLSAMDKSAEENSRIIASNLARLKAAEIRKDLQAKTDFGNFASWLNGGGSSLVGQDIRSADQFSEVQFEEERRRYQDWVQPTVINGCKYQYTLKFATEGPVDNKGNSREQVLKTMISNPNDYEIRMIVQVHWAGDLAKPAKSTHVDTYIVNRGE